MVNLLNVNRNNRFFFGKVTIFSIMKKTTLRGLALFFIFANLFNIRLGN